MERIEELLKDLDTCEPQAIRLEPGAWARRVERRAKVVLAAAVLTTLCLVSTGLWHTFVHKLPEDIACVVLRVWFVPQGLFVVFLVLDIVANRAGKLYRERTGEPQRADSPRLTARAERAHIALLSRYPDALLRCAQHYLTQPRPATAQGFTLSQVPEKLAAIVSVALACGVGIQTWAGCLTQPGQFWIGYVLVLLSLFVLAVAISRGRTRRRRHYHYWLLELVLLEKAATRGPMRSLNRRRVIGRG
ncbi:hypothetical protein AB4Y40_14090 [Paraburkholderia sp. EG287B]|uniref:hypothetical protein n=1 Tax=Paraburkholderia sp. EG287B TaxID=3237010 RepID=UPI0034D1D6B7